MAIEVKFGDLVLDGVQRWESRLQSRAQVQRFPRRHGGIVQDIAFLTDRRIALVGKVAKATTVSLNSYLDGLARRLLELGLDKLAFYDDDSRYLNAIFDRYNIRATIDNAPALLREYDLDFLVADPFWYSTTESDSGLQQPNASPFTFSVTNNGEAETPPRIEITAVGADKSNIKITNTTTSLFVDFTGTIGAGNTLILDLDEFEAQNGGANGMPDITTGSSPWHLIRGLNNIEYTGPTSGVDLKIFWTERYPT